MGMWEDGLWCIGEGMPLGKRGEIYFTVKENNEEILVVLLDLVSCQ